MPRVINMRLEGLPPGAVRCDRATKFGNPHRVDASCPRLVAIARYKDDLNAGRLKVSVDDVKRELRGKDLACWCAPLPCHCDVLIEVANR